MSETLPPCSQALLRSRSRADYGVFVLDSQTSQCLHYEAAVGYPPTRHVRIPRDVLAEHPEVEIRNDLIDCYIDVCSIEVRLFGRCEAVNSNPGGK